MPMDSVTEEHVAHILKEKTDTERELTILISTTTNEMWLKELLCFEKEYDMYKKKREKIQAGSFTKQTDVKQKKVAIKK
jgi:hypothetical protein